MPAGLDVNVPRCTHFLIALLIPPKEKSCQCLKGWQCYS